jgi:hypothetical protein
VGEHLSKADAPDLTSARKDERCAFRRKIPMPEEEVHMSMHKGTPCDDRPMTKVMRHKKIPFFAGASLLLLASLLISCSTPAGQKGPANAAKTEKGEKLQQAGPIPGDVRIENGVEYVYAHNNRYGITPDEPEYAWIRKEYYAPGGNEPRLSNSAWEKERKELLERLEKLEAEVKQSGQGQ